MRGTEHPSKTTQNLSCNPSKLFVDDDLDLGLVPSPSPLGTLKKKKKFPKNKFNKKPI